MAEGRKGFFGRFGRSRSDDQLAGAPEVDPGGGTPEPGEAAPDDTAPQEERDPIPADILTEAPAAEEMEPAAAEPESAPDAPGGRPGWLRRLRSGLGRSSSALTGSISSIFTKRRLDEETLEEFEDALIRADLGRLSETSASSDIIAMMWSFDAMTLATS